MVLGFAADGREIVSFARRFSSQLGYRLRHAGVAATFEPHTTVEVTKNPLVRVCVCVLERKGSGTIVLFFNERSKVSCRVLGEFGPLRTCCPKSYSHLEWYSDWR